MNKELDEVVQSAEPAASPVQTGQAASQPDEITYSKDNIDPEDILPSLY